LDKLKNKSHDAICHGLNESAEPPNNALYIYELGDDEMGMMPYNDNTAEVALQLIPVIAVIDTDDLVLKTNVECNSKQCNEKRTCIFRSCSILCNIAITVFCTTGIQSVDE
jgi:hypothetical protein